MKTKLLLLALLFSISFAFKRQNTEFDVNVTSTSSEQQYIETLMAETFNSSKCINCINTNANQYEGACSNMDYPSTCETNFHIYKLMFIQCILSLNCQYQQKIGYSNKCICQCLNLTENITEQLPSSIQNDNQSTIANTTELIAEVITNQTQINETTNTTNTSPTNIKTSSVSLIPLEVLQQNPSMVNFVQCYLEASCGGQYMNRFYQNCSIILFSRKIMISLINLLIILFCFLFS